MMQPTLSLEQTYVAPATLLPANLRAHASAANLCFFQVVDCAPNVERLFVRVAALPHRLDETDSPRVFTACLSAEQLAQSLLWDRAMQARPTCDVRELVELHVKDICGTLSTVVPAAAPTASAQVPQQEEMKEEEITFVALPEIFVSCETMQEVAGDVQPPRAHAPRHKQQAWARLNWLREAIAMLRRQQSHANQLPGKLFIFLARLDTMLRRAFVAQHHMRQPLVCARPVFIADRQVGWHMIVGVPLSVAFAAA